ncbi:protein MIZU-KUSSEI 1 [Vigna radiata var. radiata]|uniref:Protein MIZU-KUSSEI 1 n=1 Tax=Vigna radiata var. radiata TaxID=3916 RepID=A0A1S3VND8_VIGRR|nr:protein MIZU-KUSSEI 1 [Vigna radiata var. radiata]
MKTIMAAKFPHDSSFSFSRRYFHWKKKALDEEDDDNEEEMLNFSTSSSHFLDEKQQDYNHPLQMSSRHATMTTEHKKKPNLSKLKSALTVFTKRTQLGTRVVGTLFGHRRGHVHFAIQEDPKAGPAFLIQLATPTSVLVREMASGLVRIALECEKKKSEKSNSGLKLVEEGVWRTYCNGRKCGYASRRECGPEEWKILKAVEPISMGAGVLPVEGCEEGEVMYMRARYERVVGSRDSEAFYMMNPDGVGGPELSIYLIRV